jgi:hypothetical protein
MRTLNFREISLLSLKKCSLVEEEREDVEKKVGEALDENFTALAEREKKKRGDSTGILYTRHMKIQ